MPSHQHNNILAVKAQRIVELEKEVNELKKTNELHRLVACAARLGLLESAA